MAVYEKPSSCAVCGSDTGLTFILSHSDPGGETYDLYECVSCSVQFFVPLKNPGAEWYATHERYTYRNTIVDSRVNQKQQQVIDFLEGRTKKGRILDVGCGTGHFLADMNTRGWEVWGTDFDQAAISSAEQAFGLTHLEVTGIKDFVTRHPNLTFDAITFFDVLEHLDDHTEFIAQIRSLLAPGGVIGFSMPYRHCWRVLIQGDLPPNHLTRWDEPSVTHFLNRSGFSLLAIKHFPAHLYLFIVKMRFRYGNWTSIGLVQKAQVGASAHRTVNGTAPTTTFNVSVARILAKIKDCVLFGIPAIILWLVFFPTRKRYTDLIVIASRR